MTRTCPSCATEVPEGVRFCPNCDEFLDWEQAPTGPAYTGGGRSRQDPEPGPTSGGGTRPGSPDDRTRGADASGPARQAPAPNSPGTPAPASGPNATRPALRGGGDALHVEPGSSVTTSVLVATTGTLVDEIHLHLEGPGAAFGDVTPSVVHLYPGGNESVTLTFTAARGPTVPAGSHGWVLHAISPTHGGASSSIAGVVEVAAFALGSAELHPTQTTGRGREFQHSVALANDGNVAWSATVLAEDVEHLHLTVPAAPVAVEPGERVDVQLAGHTRRRWLGSAQTLPFRVHLEPASEPGPEPGELLGTRTQRAILPVWLIPAVLVLVGLGIAAYAVFGGDKVEVPTVRDQPTAAAMATLEEAGFIVTPSMVADDDIKAGRAVGTEPPAASVVAKGSAVTLSLSAGPKLGKIPIPTVIGSPLDDARADIKSAGLRLRVEEEASTEQDPGIVTRTVPDAGTEVPKAYRVVVYVSAGPPAVTIPSVSDLTGDEAADALKQLGLVVRTVTEPSDEIPAGTAIRTDPGEGQGVPAASRVTLVVSSGPLPRVTIPPVAGLATGEARDALEALDLEVTVQEQSDESVPADQVIGTDPAEGGDVPVGSEIALLVSTGPAPVEDPSDLLGLAADDPAVSAYAEANGGSWDGSDVDLPNGVEIVADEFTGTVATIAFDPSYPGDLPLGLSWEMTADDITNELGSSPVILGELPDPIGGGTALTGVWEVDRAPVQGVSVLFDPSDLLPTAITLRAVA